MDTRSELGFHNLKNNLPAIYWDAIERLEALHDKGECVKSRLYSIIEEAEEMQYIDHEEYQLAEAIIAEDIE